jgi:hypothetical protein
MRILERAVALEPIDLVLLEQELDAAGEALDRIGLVRLQCGKIEFDLAELDPVAREAAIRRLGKLLRAMQQRLGRDAPDVEASPAERLAPLGASHLQP